MCTIMTISSEFYTANRSAINTQIRRDALFNRDGWSIVAFNDSTSNSISMRCLDLDETIVLIDWIASRYTRIWLHTRYATTGYVGLNGTHAFAAGDWNVMHNGFISDAAAHEKLVDSELIVDWINQSNAVDAATRIVQTQSYANCMLINNTDGGYIVTRTATGSLFTDGAGNYSTNKMATISTPVATGVYTHDGVEVDALVNDGDVNNKYDFFDTLYEMGIEKWSDVSDEFLYSLTAAQLDYLDEYLSDMNNYSLRRA